MKQGFYSKQVEQFRLALNGLILVYCGVRDYYDLEGAAAELQRLSKAWRRSTNYVFYTIMEEARAAADARLLYYMDKCAKVLNVPITTEKLRESWKNLTDDEKVKLADTALARMQ